MEKAAMGDAGGGRDRENGDGRGKLGQEKASGFERLVGALEAARDRLARVDFVTSRAERRRRAAEVELEGFRKEHPLRTWLHDHGIRSGELERLQQTLELRVVEHGTVGRTRTRVFTQYLAELERSGGDALRPEKDQAHVKQLDGARRAEACERSREAGRER
jgi:hypothetical protein